VLEKGEVPHHNAILLKKKKKSGVGGRKAACILVAEKYNIMPKITRMNVFNAFSVDVCYRHKCDKRSIRKCSA